MTTFLWLSAITFVFLVLVIGALKTVEIFKEIQGRKPHFIACRDHIPLSMCDPDRYYIENRRPYKKK